MKRGTTVKLMTFAGTVNPKKRTDPQNNYWKLIGEKGSVVDDQLYDDRVLVLFDNDLNNFNVANHNPIPNSLWIEETDLEIQNQPPNERTEP